MNGLLMADAEVLRGQTVIVTGAASGVGRAVARGLVAAGAWVGMIGPRDSTLAAAAEEVGGHAIPADPAVPADVHQVTEYLVELLGDGPDLLVNAADALVPRPLAQTEPDDFERQVAVNLRSPFLMIRAFLPLMLERGAGQVISIGSAAGRAATPGHGAYSATKFALRGLHEVLAREVAGTGVRATLIEVPSAGASLSEPASSGGAPALRPEDVARAVLFAASQPREVQIPVLALRSSAE